MLNKNTFIIKTLILGFILSCSTLNANSFKRLNTSIAKLQETPIRVEYLEANVVTSQFTELSMQNSSVNAQTRTTEYANNAYKVIISEIFRDDYIEVNGELEHLIAGNSCVTLRVVFPLEGNNWIWYQGFEKKLNMDSDSTYSDVKEVSTILPPDGLIVA